MVYQRLYIIFVLRYCCNWDVLWLWFFALVLCGCKYCDVVPLYVGDGDGVEEAIGMEEAMGWRWYGDGS